MLKILAFAGSTRRGSFNQMLLQEAHRLAPEGCQITLLHLKDHPLPLYDADLEAENGLPEGAIQLRHLLKSHHALLLATPEYNGGLPAVLKNTLDWMSRKHGTERGLDPFMHKPAAVVSASPGMYGGVRGVQAAVFLLHRLGCLVLPDTLSISNAEGAFDAAGQLTGKDEKNLRRVMENLTRIGLKLQG